MKLSTPVFLSAPVFLVTHNSAPAQTPGVSQPSTLSHRQLVRQIRRLEGAQDMVNMPSVAPLFLEDAQFSSTLYIVNDGIPSVSGRLLLLAPDGQIISDKTVTVGGHDKLEVPVKPMLETAHSTATRGSIELFDDNIDGPSLAGEVVITFHGQSTSVNIDEELLMPTMSQSHELRGIAVDAVANPIVSITSTSEQPVQVFVKCSGERSKPTQLSFQIRSHQIVTLRPCLDSPAPIDAAQSFHFEAKDLAPAESKGIQILSSDPKAEIQAFGFSPTMTGGAFSFVPIPFQDRGDILSTEIIFPGVPVGNTGELWGTYRPRVAVQNLSSETRQITVHNAQTRFGISTYRNVTQFSVSPHAVVSADIVTEGNSPGDLDTYVIESDGQPADVQTQVWAEEENRKRQIVFAGKDAKDDRNGGLHPWTLQNGSQDGLYLFNQTDADQPFLVTGDQRSENSYID